MNLITFLALGVLISGSVEANTASGEKEVFLTNQVVTAQLNPSEYRAWCSMPDVWGSTELLLHRESLTGLSSLRIRDFSQLATVDHGCDDLANVLYSNRAVNVRVETSEIYKWGVPPQYSAPTCNHHRLESLTILGPSGSGLYLLGFKNGAWQPADYTYCSGLL